MKKKLLGILLIVAVFAGLTFVAGCETDAQTGALLGTAIGVGVGQAIGRDTEGTLIGAAIGAGAGYIIGNESDKKKARTEPKPEIVQSPAKTDTGNYTTVNVQNDNGSVSPVKLKKQGVGYVGPKGEYYDHLPAEEELRLAGYGL